MDWIELCIHTTNEAVEPISNILHEAGASGVVIEDVVDIQQDFETPFGEIYALSAEGYPEEGVFVKAYLAKTDAIDTEIANIKKDIEHLKTYQIDIGLNITTMKIINEENWAHAWKKYYKPAKVSERVVIVPEWEDYELESPDELKIILDPGMAFGTGTHPTTMLSIRSLEKYVKTDDIVIDVGCGSGVLSIGASILGAKDIYAFDLDEVAVNSTISNLALNGLENKVTVGQNNLLENIDLQANVIVSNILAEIIVKFVGDAWNNLVSGGLFITSGIIEPKKALVVEELERHGFKIIEVNQIEDWVSIVAQKE